MSADSGFYSIIDYTVDGPGTQRELVEAFAEIQERWVRFYPGYRSARFHVSLDGTRVYNIVHWDSEADYRHFETTSDTEGRMAAIKRALEGLSGKAEARMSGLPHYAVVREVGPGPRRDDS
ncbi:antibiotic biosynthesis monooxygenase [Actinomadura sp. 7K534]|uniref:antibiotic biosynthesis monooxygenase family protein n=1 Tax=Actinomadura sp. 7K534 TaxID=2530366 RepID=UPI0010451720|nr:antibiotic biosynthesis monooxygenase [Actinomadura sp. 7K534]TDB86772.1 antibiotic biosynthesis monooxygenase [Actinomadura sp. 7K534]